MTSDTPPVLISGQENIEQLLDILDTALQFKLSRRALIELLERYIDGLISAESVVDLAEALEMNERVNVDQARDVGINDALFELANPAINGELTRTKALSLVEALRTT